MRTVSLTECQRIHKRDREENADRIAFCKRLPKIELNAHLTGSLNISTVVRYYDPDVTNKSLHYYIDYFHSPKSLERHKKLYVMNDCVLGTQESLTAAVMDVIKDFLDDNTFYLELKVAPHNYNESLTKEQYIVAVIYAVRLAKITLPGIIVKIICLINREHTYEDCIDTCTLIFKYFRIYNDIIVGVHLYGSPNSNASSHHHILNLCRNEGLNIIISSSEISYHTETWGSIEYLPDRLSQCNHVHPHYDGASYLFSKLLDSRIPVELCLTYDVDTNKINSYAEHHFKYLYRNQHPISISTRDKGICKTTLSEEYAIIASHFALTKNNLLYLSRSTLLQSFATEYEKRSLLDIFNQFERNEILQIADT